MGDGKWVPGKSKGRPKNQSVATRRGEDLKDPKRADKLLRDFASIQQPTKGEEDG